MDYKESMNYRKILVVNLGGMGDIILSTPALRALKNHFPAAHISMLVAPSVSEVARGFSYISNVFIFFKKCSPVSFLKNIYTLLKLRRSHFDILINMRTMTSARSAGKLSSLISFINPSVKVGRNTEGRGTFFDIKIPETDEGDRYEMEYDIETVKTLGIEVIDRSINFSIDKKSEENVNKILEKEGVTEGVILIGIHPGGPPCHRWSIENFSSLVKEIKEKINCRFVITGIASEKYLATRLITMVGAQLINMVEYKRIRLSYKKVQSLYF
jgi:ADP-heptose:LPS heptosyltransferase